jgi:hypothetical protein
MKGFGIEKMAALFGVLIAGAFMIGIVAGPMMAAAESGQDDLNNMLNQNRTVTIEHRNNLADAANYVWDRAHGCEKVRNMYDNDGYPGLAGTPYTRYPPCVDSTRVSEMAAAGIAIDGIASAAGFEGIGDHVSDVLQGGQDMEGRYGRIYFQVENEIELGTFRNYGTPEAEPMFYALAPTKDTTYHDLVDVSNCGDRLVDMSEGTEGFLVAFNGNTGADGEDRVTGIGSQTTFVDDNEVQDEIGNRWLVSSSPYCKEKVVVQAYLSHGQIREYFNGNSRRQGIKLCPGDRGYIQVTKNVPSNFGEADSPLDDRGAAGAVWKNSYHPFIQITHIEEDACGSADSPGGSDVDDSFDLPQPDSWSGIPTRGKQLEIEANLDSPNSPTEFTLDNSANGDLKGCQIKITETGSGETAYVNWTTGGKNKVTPFFRRSTLPDPQYGAKDDDLDDDDHDQVEELYGKIELSGRQIPNDLDILVDQQNGNGDRLELWRDLLCIDANTLSGTDKNGEWVMCGGDGDYGFPASPDHWRCVNPSNHDEIESGWYPQEEPWNECSGNTPNRLRGYTDNYDCD